MKSVSALSASFARLQFGKDLSHVLVAALVTWTRSIKAISGELEIFHFGDLTQIPVMAGGYMPSLSLITTKNIIPCS